MLCAGRHVLKYAFALHQGVKVKPERPPQAATPNISTFLSSEMFGVYCPRDGHTEQEKTDATPQRIDCRQHLQPPTREIERFWSQGRSIQDKVGAA